MILGANKIVKMIRNGVIVTDTNNNTIKKPLIENIGDDQINKIEGTTVDLRIHKAYRTEGGARLYLNSRTTPTIEEVYEDSDYIEIYANSFLLVQSMERVNLPINMIADIRNRTTMFRCGLFLKTAYVSPNYQGVLTFGLYNASDFKVVIEKGFRIACISFMYIDGNAVPYTGIWQGDRVSTDGEADRPF